MATALATLMSLPAVSLASQASPVHALDRLAAALGADSPRLLIKRDDLLSFGWGGNKVRKLQTVLAEARAAGADTLITCGGLQSNHARATAAAGSVLGMKVILVLNGQAPPTPTGNLRLDALFGADVRIVDSREARATTMEAVAEEVRASGGTPFVIPLGASNATGAIGFARGVAELAAAGVRPDVIVHASSSGGTQAGLIAGCALLGLQARVIGVSADERAADLAAIVARPHRGHGRSARRASRPRSARIVRLTSTTRKWARATACRRRRRRRRRRCSLGGRAWCVDPVYTSKAMAACRPRARGDFAATRPCSSGTPAASRSRHRLFPRRFVAIATAASPRRSGVYIEGTACEVTCRQLPLIRADRSIVTITFMGAARTVTGSKHLLDTGAHRILVDCGLFQGLKDSASATGRPLPVEGRHDRRRSC